jgi:ribonuclease VapC
MVIDTSIITAIVLNEAEARTFEGLISEDPVRLISAATVLEASMVIESRRGEAGAKEFDVWLYVTGVKIVPVDTEHAEQARLAWRRFGKGRHPASLNFGDCFSYALAKMSRQPLLFKGNDFSKTDIEAVWR